MVIARRIFRGVFWAGALIVFLANLCFSQTRMGDQRVGTASGSFLRIGIGARPAAMAGAYTAICDDVTACAWNPAGLTHLSSGQLALTHAAWAADIAYNHVCYGFPVEILDGVVAFQFGSLSTEIIETTEYHPYGTGREFTFSDWLFGVSVGKRFTDRFSGGFALKYVRENLGTEIGGPSTSTLVMDAGTYYQIGPRNMRLAVALTNFGSDMIPEGSFMKRIGSAYTEAPYQGFSPATEFKFGIGVEPITTASIRSVVDFELMHPADNSETVRIGCEVGVSDLIFIRAGHDAAADELKTSLGLGATIKIASKRARLDYAVTLSEHLGSLHRLTFLIDL
ncbi:MAG: PorV/PorQ family protein [bacterium]